MSNNPINPPNSLPPIQPAKLQNPFTPQQVEDMKTLRKNLDIAQKHVDLAKKAGLDTTILQSQIDDKKKQLEGLINVYGNPLNFSG